MIYPYISYIINLCAKSVDWDKADDNDNILFDHNVQIEITIFNSLENQIKN